MKIDSVTASDILSRVGADRDTDFHTLPSRQVDRLLEFADLYKYRKPKNANGSRGRYFFAYLQRQRNAA